MKKVVLIYGLIAGTIVAAMMFITMPMYQAGTLKLENGELVGYTTMAVALSMVFFGIKSYRDNYAGGEIKFWKAVQIGLLITAIASVMYALAWEVNYSSIGDEFMAKMYEHQMHELKLDGASADEIEKSKASWEQFNQLYRIAIFRFLFTIVVEIAPVGIIFTFISAGLLRKKTFLPAAPKVTRAAS